VENIMNRFHVQLAAFALFSLLGWVMPAAAAEPEKPAKWKSADGKFVLENATTLKVTLLRLSDNEVLEGNWEKLSPAMRQSIAAYWVEQDRLQLQAVRGLLTSTTKTPDAVNNQLQVLHQDWPTSPYAGLALAVRLSGLQNQPEKAMPLLRQVVQRIETQRMLSPEAHRVTLTSVYNNAAICSIKGKKADVAMASLVKALEQAHLPVVIHNAEQLLEFGGATKGPLTLTEGQRERLGKALTQKPTGQTSELKRGWHYCMLIDDARSRATAETLGGLVPPAEGLELREVTTGVAIGPNTLLAPAATIREQLRDLKALSVMVRSEGTWIAHSVEQIVMQVGGMPQQPAVRGLQIRDVSSFATPGVTWAALQVPTGQFQPATFESSRGNAGGGLANSGPTGPLELAFFRARPEMLTEGYETRPLEISAVGLATGTLPGELLPEERGAAAINPLGLVRGLAFHQLQASTKQGQLVGAEQLNAWAQRHLQLELKLAAPEETADVKESVVPVLFWGSPPPVSESGVALLASRNEPGAGAVAVDMWCVPCSGKGFYRCPNCIRGVVTVKETAPTGINPVNGSVIYGPVSVSSPCKNCSASGALKCPHCDGGRIKER
jgi:hypothetical protein